MSIWRDPAYANAAGDVIAATSDEAGAALIARDVAPEIFAALEALGPAPFVALPPREAAVPAEVTPAQARIALSRVPYGDATLLDAAEAAIAAYPGATGREVAIWWRHAETIERDNAYLNGIGVELGLDDEAVDALFRIASAIRL